MSRSRPAPYYPGRVQTAHSRAQDLYMEAVQRNLKSALNECLLKRWQLTPDALAMMEELSLERTRVKLGLRKGDNSWDIDVQNLRCARLASWVCLHFPRDLQQEFREWLIEPFASMDGGERMRWMSRFNLGVQVLEGKNPATFGHGFVNWN